MSEEDHARAAHARRFLFGSAYLHLWIDRDMSQDGWMEWVARTYPFSVADLGDGELDHIAEIAATGAKGERRPKGRRRR